MAKKEKTEKQLIIETNNKLDKIIAILLARSGLDRREVAKSLKVSEKTIERMFPFNKVKRVVKENERK